MDELRFIDTRAHGVLDYLVGVVLIAARDRPRSAFELHDDRVVTGNELRQAELHRPGRARAGEWRQLRDDLPGARARSASQLHGVGARTGGLLVVDPVDEDAGAIAADVRQDCARACDVRVVGLLQVECNLARIPGALPAGASAAPSRDERRGGNNDSQPGAHVSVLPGPTCRKRRRRQVLRALDGGTASTHDMHL